MMLKYLLLVACSLLLYCTDSTTESPIPLSAPSNAAFVSSTPSISSSHRLNDTLTQKISSSSQQIQEGDSLSSATIPSSQDSDSSVDTIISYSSSSQIISQGLSSSGIETSTVSSSVHDTPLSSQLSSSSSSSSSSSFGQNSSSHIESSSSTLSSSSEPSSCQPESSSSSGTISSNSAVPVPPEAHTVCITGVHSVGSVLRGSYSYTDVNGDLEGNSQYQWYRDASALTGATDTLYTLQPDDMGTIVSFKVTPIAQSGGVTTGNESIVYDTVYFENVVEENALTDSRDGETYNIVYIGLQIWMAENLRYLPQVDSGEVGAELTGRENDSFYYVYGYTPDGVETEADQILDAKQHVNYTTYGVLYNLKAAMAGTMINHDDLNPSGVQGICPNTWHFPSDTEWEEMSVYTANVTGDTTRLITTGPRKRWMDLGTDLKADSDLWHRYLWGQDSVEAKGSDDVGFAGLPGGLRDQTGYFGLNIHVQWWTSAQTLSSGQWIPTTHLIAQIGSFRRDNFNYQKHFGHSIRCVKNR